MIAIERRSFPTAWSLAMFVLELSKPSGICLAATAEDACRLPRRSRDDQVWHLMNIAVDPEHRRDGSPHSDPHLFEAAGDRLPYTLEVRVSNLRRSRCMRGSASGPPGSVAAITTTTARTP